MIVWCVYLGHEFVHRIALSVYSETETSGDGLVLTRQGVFGLSYYFFSVWSLLTTVLTAVRPSRGKSAVNRCLCLGLV